ncbi:MAG: FecR domain-containing protein [Pedobacter sp.]|jgi:ferric-dicitrate binding protein FerR (iron transport regulator)|uniref:FecR family protein n=1 Tax=Pedobacter sp. TaxID=1411316 RepID=UPI003565BDD7
MNDELLIKFLLKETSEEENAEVQRWLSMDTENATYFAQFEKIWNASGSLKEKTTVDENEAWLKFKEKADQRLTKKETIVNPLNRMNAWLKIAAVFVLGLSIWTVYNFFGNSTYQDIFSGDKVISQILPDGSELTINKNSEISYANNFKTNRRVHLKKGDVFFNVAHDKSNPFIIKIDDVSVEVVGTSFNIQHLKDETEVVVESGIVKVSLGSEEITLVKGERILIDANTKVLIKKQSDDQLYNYYRTKLFVANNTPLPELVAKLNEAYGSNIVLGDEVKDLTIYITLELGSLENNLKYVCDALKLKVSRNQHEILLSYK